MPYYVWWYILNCFLNFKGSLFSPAVELLFELFGYSSKKQPDRKGGRSLSVQDSFGTYTFGTCFFGTGTFGTLNVNIGTVTFGTYKISVQSTSVHKCQFW